jgi:sugar lactone lactonase YvrE
MASAQTGDMRVYTVAFSTASTATLGDGGPATAAQLEGCEGIWLDGECNIYISDIGNTRIRKVNAATGIITTIAGTGMVGFAGDGGPATSATMNQPYGLYADVTGTVYFADMNNNRIRKIDAVTGIISTIAGGGTSLSDGGQATNAQLNAPDNVYLDNVGNIYIGQKGSIKKVNTAGIITTIAGNGTVGLSGDGGPATNALIHTASTILMDGFGNLIFADRGDSRIRKIAAATGIISTITGSTTGYSGDGGLATNAQVDNPISFVIDQYGNLVIGDNSNNVMRKVDAATGIITTIAGDTSSSATTVEGALATSTDMHPEFMYLDLSGNIYYTQWIAGTVRKINRYNPGLPNGGNMCGFTEVTTVMNSNDTIEIYPNPATNELNMKTGDRFNSVTIANSLGQVFIRQKIVSEQTNINIRRLPKGMYFITASGNNGSKEKKFVKM